MLVLQKELKTFCYCTVLIHLNLCFCFSKFNFTLVTFCKNKTNFLRACSSLDCSKFSGSSFCYGSFFFITQSATLSWLPLLCPSLRFGGKQSQETANTFPALGGEEGRGERAL